MPLVYYLKVPSSPYPRPSRFSSVLSSRNFIVLYFIFRSVTYFELMLVKVILVFLRYEMVSRIGVPVYNIMHMGNKDLIYIHLFFKHPGIN